LNSRLFRPGPGDLAGWLRRLALNTVLTVGGGDHLALAVYRIAQELDLHIPTEHKCMRRACSPRSNGVVLELKTIAAKAQSSGSGSGNNAC